MTYTHVLSRVSLVPVRLLYWHFLLSVLSVYWNLGAYSLGLIADYWGAQR